MTKIFLCDILYSCKCKLFIQIYCMYTTNLAFIPKKSTKITSYSQDAAA